MNVERMNKVADMIQANPEHFAMTTWVGGPGLDWDQSFLPSVVVQADLSKCGTTACIAGWACNLWGAEVEPEDSIEMNAGRILGLRDEGESLFYRGELNTADKAADHLRRMALDYEAERA